MINSHPHLSLIGGGVSGHKSPSYSAEMMGSANAKSWRTDGLP